MISYHFILTTLLVFSLFRYLVYINFRLLIAQGVGYDLYVMLISYTLYHLFCT